MIGMMCSFCANCKDCDGSCYVYATKGTEYCTKFVPKLSKETPLRPVPERISSWGSGMEIIYRCRSCQQSFSIAGQGETYCHHCGQKVDWDSVQGFLTP